MRRILIAVLLLGVAVGCGGDGSPLPLRRRQMNSRRWRYSPELSIGAPAARASCSLRRPVSGSPSPASVAPRSCAGDVLQRSGDRLWYLAHDLAAALPSWFACGHT